MVSILEYTNQRYSNSKLSKVEQQLEMVEKPNLDHCKKIKGKKIKNKLFNFMFYFS